MSEQSVKPVSLLLVSSQSQSGGRKIMWSQGTKNADTME